MFDWALSYDGTEVVFTQGFGDQLLIGDLGTVGIEMLLEGATAGPHWGVDGWIYYAQYQEQDGRWEVYRIRPSDGERQRVTSDGGEQPELSPDGTTLLYLGPSGLTLSDPDGANPRALGVPHFVHNPEWSPDGSLIAAHVFGPEWWRDHQLTTIDPMTGETTTLTSRPYHWWDGFAWSPDGTKLVYPAVQTTDEWWWDWDHDGDLYVVSVDGRNLGRLTHYGDMQFADPVWRD
jgi:Tol biopolymer transport system component